MNPLYLIIYALSGAATGSFLNVCILRIPEHETVVTGRSRCCSCNRKLPAHTMVPILSWFALRGKCCFCGASISPQYPAVEAQTAILFTLCCLAKGPGTEASILCAFASLLTVAAWIDARHMYIPDGIHLCILILAILSMALSQRPGITERLAGVLACGGFLELIRLISKGGVGGGDVKLLASSGLLIGWKAGMASIFMAYVIAGLWFLIPLLRGRVNGKTRVPMAPFFALALMVCGLYCRELLTWYLGLFLP